MSKHPTDQPRTRGASRLAAFLRQDLAESPSQATLALQSRPQSRDAASRKTAEFLRIARHRTD
ncbi:hypothetical protein PANO111632_17685 [Paracoccus nototheniae]|uniref:Uncharacterized protein n=1 Tax=Paracoccus nototheniae TaxID=2489002 RepID=A0ABW4DTD8_9RHOB|nr:hypothetical protein [Paracoccus nototheniae]